MTVYLNGKFVPESQAVVSVFDRSFLYGDGVFETVRIFNGKLFRWPQHFERLQRGLEFLRIKLPASSSQIENHASQLVAENRMPDALVRLTISRGAGKRGYSPAGANAPFFVMTLHPAPVAIPANATGWKLITSTVRLPAGDPLTQYKTCCKLPQILARSEADAAGADDALLLNNEGWVVEGSSSNLFWIDGGDVCTPPLPSGILPGVTRAVVVEIAKNLGLPTRESKVHREELAAKSALFLSMSSLGIVRCDSLDGAVLSQSPLVEKLNDAYVKLLAFETA